MKALSISLLLLLVAGAIYSQDKYFTKTGKIFFQCAKSPLEKVEATNKSTTCLMLSNIGWVRPPIVVQ